MRPRRRRAAALLPLVWAAHGVGCAPACPVSSAEATPASEATLARVECALASKVFEALVRRRTSENIVFSPHAILRAVAYIARHADADRQRRLMSSLGYAGSADSLWAELERAELALHAGAGPEILGPIDLDEYFDYSSFLGSVPAERSARGAAAAGHSDGPPTPSRTAGHAGLGESRPSRFVERGLLGAASRNARTGRATLLSIVDLRLSGTPLVGPGSRVRGSFGEAETSFAHLKLWSDYACAPAYRGTSWWAEPPSLTPGRARVAFWAPSAHDRTPGRLPTPCNEAASLRDAAPADLDFRAPAFCARSELDLGDLAADLDLPTTAADVPATWLPVRLAFDSPGTFNAPDRFLRDPVTELDVRRGYPERELTLDHPFFVTIHDPGSGAIFYVAWIRRAGDPRACL